MLRSFPGKLRVLLTLMGKTWHACLSKVPEPFCAEGGGAVLLYHPLSPGATPPRQVVKWQLQTQSWPLGALPWCPHAAAGQPSFPGCLAEEKCLGGWAGLGWQESCLLVSVPRCAAQGFAACQRGAQMGLGTRGQSILVCRIPLSTRRGFRVQLCTHLFFSP